MITIRGTSFFMSLHYEKDTFTELIMFKEIID